MAGRFFALLLLAFFALPAQFARSASTPVLPKSCCTHMEVGKACEGCSGAPASQHAKCCVDASFQVFFSKTILVVPRRTLTFAADFSTDVAELRNEAPLLEPPRVG